MAFVFANPNPRQVRRVGDCVVRAISLATGSTWEDVYSKLSAYGFILGDMPTSNEVWGQYLSDLGYKRNAVNGACPYCTIDEFSVKNKSGTFILGTGSHLVCVKNGDYYDTWDSGDEMPIFYWRVK